MKSCHVDGFVMSNPQALCSGASGWESRFLVTCSGLKCSSSSLNSAADKKNLAINVTQFHAFPVPTQGTFMLLCSSSPRLFFIPPP